MITRPCIRCGVGVTLFNEKQVAWCGCPSPAFKERWVVVGNLEPMPGAWLLTGLIKLYDNSPRTTAFIAHKTAQLAIPGIQYHTPHGLYRTYAAFGSKMEASHAKLLLALPSEIKMALIVAGSCKLLRRHSIWARRP